MVRGITLATSALLVLLLVAGQAPQEGAAAAARPTQGTIFWAAYTETPDLGSQPFALFAVNSGATPADVEITGWNGAVGASEVVAGGTVGPGTMERFEVDAITLARPGVVTEGIFRVESSNPVAVFQVSTGQSMQANDGAWLAPQDQLGDHYVAYTKNEGPLPSYVVVMATSPGTTVTAVVPEGALGSESMPGVTISTLPGVALESWGTGTPGQLVSAVLEPFQALHLRSGYGFDLSGTIVKSDSPVSVIAGAVCTSIGGSGSCDHLADQMQPTDSWGTTYAVCPSVPVEMNDWPYLEALAAYEEGWTSVAPTPPNYPMYPVRSDAPLYRIGALAEDTTVMIRDDEGATIQVIAPGSWIDVKKAEGWVLESTLPVSVTEFLGGDVRPQAAHTWSWGDPSMAQLPATDRWWSRGSIGVPSGFFMNFVTIATEGTDIGGQVHAPVIQFDGRVLREHDRIGDTDYFCTRVGGVEPGLHSVAHGGGGRLAVTITGWDNYGSYLLAAR